jgi:hypothetical protein
MNNDLLKNGSFVKAVIRDEETAYLICSNDKSTREKIAHAVLMQWDGGIFGHIAVFDQYAAGIDVLRGSAPQMIAVSEYGNVVVFGSGESYNEKISGSIKGSGITYPLRCVKEIESQVFVAGANRQVFKRINRGQWTQISPNQIPDSDIIAFEAIDGFSASDVYFVGWKGAIYWLHDGEWNRVEPPTNLILTDVCCAPDGMVYICGQSGLLLCGKENQWQVINTEIKHDFWSMQWFNGRLYLSTFYDLYVLLGRELKAVDLRDFKNVTLFNLTAKGDLLWSVGAKDILATNGKDWWRVAG